MTDSAAETGTAGSARADGTAAPPPELPQVRGAGLVHFVIPGMVVWFALFVALLFFLPDLRAADAMAWLWTALAGWLLGFFGIGVYAWQRAAARRGSRAANAEALLEEL